MKNQINIRASAHTKTQIDKLTDKLGETQTGVIALAIDRMYREETNMNTIVYSIATSEDGLGEGVTPDMALHLAERTRFETQQWMLGHEPEVGFETRFVEETFTYGEQSYCKGTDDFICIDGPEIIEYLDQFVEKNWYDWLEVK